MVDFEKLNSMINEVNNVINDVDENTKAIEKENYNTVMLAFCKANEYLIDLRDTYIKAIGDFKDIGIEIPISDGGRIRINKQGIGVTNGENPFYYIGTIKAQLKYRYKEHNKSHPSIIWFSNLAMDFELEKEDIERHFVNGIHSILEQRSNKAHKEYDAAVLKHSVIENWN